MAKYFFILGGERNIPDVDTPKWIVREIALELLWNIHEYLAARDALFLEDNSPAKYEVLVRIHWFELEELKELRKREFDPLIVQNLDKN